MKKSTALRPRRPFAPAIFDTLETRRLMAAVKIMALGDSITAGWDSHDSYRYPLYNSLAQAGYEFDFVGTRNTIGSGSAPHAGSYDPDNEGHSGWTADQIQSNIAGWANTYKPDVVLLHIGTNDILQGQSNSGTITEVGGIIDNLRSAVPNVKIVLAKIIPASDALTQVQNFNNLIPALVTSKTTAQSPITMIDQYTGFNVNSDNFDGLHPNAGGEAKMASKWYAALQTILPAPPPLPAGTYLSNLTPTSQTNGWGPIERDRSNGEQGASDGNTIILNGVSYLKGLGVHATSDITYNIAGGNYTNFVASIGVDDESGTNGSVVFQVYTNNTLRYTSPTLTGNSATIPIDVAIPAGTTSLRLLVTDAGNGNGSDHADWAMARLIQGAATPAPTAPSSLSAGLSGSQINLSWTDASNNETGFRIERKTGVAGTYAQIADVAAGTTNYSDTSIVAGNTYYYRVYAYNSGGNSGNSNEANATFPLPPAPAAPSGLGATVNGAKIDLSWTDASNNETGFRIDRKIGVNGTYAQIADLAAGTTTYADTTAAAGVTYYYRVYAFNAGGNSGFSNEPNATIPAPTGQVYLSDLTPTSQSNGWGPFERDRSNGEQGATDGNTLNLNGVTYLKGLGVHATSDITYNLGGNYTQFLSDIGIDEESGSGGRVVFQVYLDGVLSYTSPAMTGASATQQINLTNLAGKQTLRLLVTDGGNGNAQDHADWANARLIAGAVPTAPNTLTATLNSNKIDLSWVDASSDETGFKIERKIGVNGTYALLATLNAGVQTYSDSAITGGNTYYYRVYAYNGTLNSTFSNEANAAVPLPPAPTAPSGLDAALNGAKIDLSWTDASGDETGFRIERKLGAGGTYAQIADLAAGTTSYSDTAVVQGNTYYYRVYAYNLGGNSGYSNEDNAAVPLPPAPAAPTGLGATLNGAKIDLAWTDASNNETGFRIERKIGVGGTYGQIADLAAGTQTYADTNVVGGNTYYYRVYAYNLGGNSNFTGEANATVPVSVTPVYLGDLNWTAMSNGWGPAEKNRSNGEQGATDGNVITLNGITYTKGLGVHATSDITFALNGNYTQFLSDIGVDDESGNGGRVVFQVYLDGVLSYTSPSMTGASATQQVNLQNLSGKQTLRLVVTDGGDGNGSDHADWANARLIAGAPVPVPSAPTGVTAGIVGNNVNIAWTDASSDETGFKVQRKLGTGGAWATVQTLGANATSWADALANLQGSSTYYYRVLAFNNGGDSTPSNEANIDTPIPTISDVWLSDLTWTSMTNGWGPAEKDRSNGEQGGTDGRTITLNGQTYTKGLGVHATSDITWNIAGGGYLNFSTDIGVDDESGNGGSVVFQVYVNGVLTYTSPTMTGASATIPVSIPLNNANTLRLRVSDAGNGNGSDHADWAGAKLTLNNNAPVTPIVSEPAVDNLVLNPADVHMQAANFSDQDGDTHASSDWEIRTIAGDELVWTAPGKSGVEKAHIHLGDGDFVNAYADLNELVANTDYKLRVRYRDSRGGVSEWGTRLFSTGIATSAAPMGLEDVVTSPAPTWLVDATQVGVELPVGTSLTLAGAAGELLLKFDGLAATGNTITNPAGLADHVHPKVTITATSAAVNLGTTTLKFSQDGNSTLSVFLPGITLAIGQSASFWVGLDGSTYVASAGETDPTFTTPARLAEIPYAMAQAGYTIDVFATGFQLATNIAFVPNPGPNANDVLFYVVELYGTIKAVTRGGTVSNYATNLLNFNPTGAFPGSGEQGVAGIVVDPTNGDVYATMVYSSVPGVEAAAHYPKIVKFTSTDGGRTAATQTTILNMSGETMGQSHQISNISIGPDGKLWVHLGDGFTISTAQNLDSFRGKIIRLNKDGTAPSDNPFYNATNGINARDYVYAYGFRNPFGGAWRDLDGKHYEVENGPQLDRLAQVVAGRNYGWNGTDASMDDFAQYTWFPSVAPVNMTFIQNSIFGGSGFPASKLDHLFISESGPTYGTGVQTLGKRISELTLDANGNAIGTATNFLSYTGSGKGTIVALAAGPDGLYFSELYKDQNYTSPIDGGARIFRVRYTG